MHREEGLSARKADKSQEIVASGTDTDSAVSWRSPRLCLPRGREEEWSPRWKRDFGQRARGSPLNPVSVQVRDGQKCWRHGFHLERVYLPRRRDSSANSLAQSVKTREVDRAEGGARMLCLPWGVMDGRGGTSPELCPGGVEKGFWTEQVLKQHAVLILGRGFGWWGAPGEQDTDGEGMGFEVPLPGIGSDLQ